MWKHGGKGRGNAVGDDERERSVCRRSSPSSLHLGIEKGKRWSSSAAW